MPQETQTQDNTIIDLNMRLRILEEKQNLIRERLLVINQNMVEEYKKVIREMKTVNSDISELREEVLNLKDMMKNVIKEMQNFAKSSSVKVLEKYIKIWDPLKFVTEEEVSYIIKKEVGNNGR